MTVVLLRHADASHGSAWAGDDRRRPLTDRGHRQAAALTTVHRDLAPDLLAASPALRCQQTLAPFAAHRGVDVEVEEALAEHAGVDAIDRLLRRLAAAERALVCTHAPVLRTVLALAHERGVPTGIRACPTAGGVALDAWPATSLTFVPPPEEG